MTLSVDPSIAIDPATLPYRPCAGITLFNAQGLVFVGRRIAGPGENEGLGEWWQMPQGGIDRDEEVETAARRELYEETNVRSATFLAATDDWIPYDLPPHLLGKAWKGRYRGQKTRWVALRFEGDDSEIDIHQPADGQHRPEFQEWRWEQLDRLPQLIVPFKRHVYEQVATAFRRFAG